MARDLKPQMNTDEHRYSAYHLGEVQAHRFFCSWRRVHGSLRMSCLNAACVLQATENRYKEKSF
jgi:hypothetical protein